MKRLLALLLAVLTICSLASCSILLNSDEQPSEKPSQEEKLPAFDFTEVTVMDNDQCTVKVIGTAMDRIIREAELLLTDKAEYDRMASAKNPYGDGKASLYIVDAIKKYFAAL